MFLRPSGAEGSAGRTGVRVAWTPTDHFAPLGEAFGNVVTIDMASLRDGEGIVQTRICALAGLPSGLVSLAASL